MARSLTEKRQRQAARRRKRELRREQRRRRSAKTRAFAVCAVALVLLVVPALFVNNVIGYFPLIAFLAAIGVSFGYLQVAKRSLTFEEPALVSQCVRGENLPFVVKLGNKSPLALVRVEPTFFVSDLFGGEDVLTTTTISLSPFETYDFDFGIRFDHIGTYTAGVRKVVVYDLLGLFSAEFANDERHVVEVAPRVFDITGMSYDRELLKEQPDARSPISMDGSDYTGVREYVIGDPMKSIHWKLSARSDFYYTKVFETLGTPGVEAILDFHGPSYGPEEMMCVFDAVVESALSMGALAQSQGMDFDLVYKDRDSADVRISSQQNTATRASFISTLPAISSKEREGEALELLRKESNSIYAQRNIVLCTSDVTEEMVSALVAAKKRQRNPMVVVAVPPGMSPDERREFLRPLAQLDNANIAHLVVCSADQLGGD